MRVSDQAFNRLKILQAIRSQGPTSRTEICLLTGLAQATVSEVTGALASRNLVIEKREEKRRPGRPRMLLEINPTGGLVLGATLSNEGDLAVSFIDLKGEVQARWSKPCHFRDLAAFAAAIVRYLDTAMAECGYRPKQVTRVVLSLPALIDNLHGQIEWMATIPPGPVPIRRMIEEHTGIPASIENDIYGMARGEHWFGRARDMNSFLLVEVDFTITGAMFINGLPSFGSNGLNSEIGHVKVDLEPDGKACFCGASGCVTSTASISGILNRSRMLNGIPLPPYDEDRANFDNLVKKAIGNDAGSLELFRLASRDLGFALANYVNILSPQRIMIVTRNPEFGKLLERFLRVSLDRYALPGIARYTDLHFIVEDPAWREKGVAATALEQIYLSG